MRQEDMPSVLMIESLVQPSPWSASLFEDCLSGQETANSRSIHIARVAELDDDLLGYGIATAVAGDAEILNLCVQPAAQGLGYGRALLDDLLEQVRGRGAETVFLEVRVSNRPAQRLYRRTGFCVAGRRKGYYVKGDEREDALILRLSL